MVRTPPPASSLFVFPLTSQQPSAERAYLAVTEIECRRGGIDYPSFLILDEYNRFLETEAFDLEVAKPLGAFSGSYMRKIALSVKSVAGNRRLRAVPRR